MYMGPEAAYRIRYVVHSVAKRRGIGGHGIEIEIENIPRYIHIAQIRHSNT